MTRNEKIARGSANLDLATGAARLQVCLRGTAKSYIAIAATAADTDCAVSWILAALAIRREQAALYAIACGIAPLGAAYAVRIAR